MKARELKNSYLPKSISTHIKMILFCAIFTPIWGLIIKADLSRFFLIATFLIMFVNMEILFFLANKIFEFKVNFTRKGITQNKITRIYITRLVLFFILALSIATVVFALFVVTFHIIKGWGFPDIISIFNELKGTIKVTAIALFLTTPVFFFIPWQQALKREFELREQNLIFQNETLKNQVNPHFLFNSLNALSSLVNTQTEIAGKFISKLSLIYRYILDNSSKVTVPLNAELAFIEDYFYLHEIRSEGKILLSVKIKEENNYEILPVSLQVLIENAIKHNMATLEKPLKIFIYIEGQYIVVKNNIQKMATQVVSTKIGLKNLNERARLIAGKEIIIEESANDFLVKVPLLS
ncbi:MAG: histidine kinase [Bacteroidales bacterium]|nr:histidine kinase [Bacteroidales bacterium]